MKMKQRPYYNNVCYKYTYGYFNIDNEIYYHFKNNITFVKIIIVRLKTKIDTQN
jgi:hypothetical protein